MEWLAETHKHVTCLCRAMTQREQLFSWDFGSGPLASFSARSTCTSQTFSVPCRRWRSSLQDYMNALRRAATLHYVRVPRVYFALSHPPSAQRSFSHAAVRLGPCRQPRLELALFKSSTPSQHLGLKPRLATLQRRAFRQLAQQEKSPPQPTPAKESPSTPPKAVISNAEQRRRDWAIVRRLAIHIWPKDDWATRGRVVLGVGLLVGGKVRSLDQSNACRQANATLHLLQLLNVQVPLFFKEVIDTLNIPLDSQSTVWVVCGSVILACTS